MFRTKGRAAGDDGLTLIELLIVLILLGIVSAIVVMAVAGFTDKGKKEACQADYDTVEAAQHARFADTGTYANNATQLVNQDYLESLPNPAFVITTGPSGVVRVQGVPGDANC